MKLRFVIALLLLAAIPALAHASAPTGSERTAAQSFTAWALSNVHPAVARIVVPGNGSISYGSGTLVYASENYGLVVTNWHVVNEAAGPISVHFPDGFYSLGKLENVDRDWDLAIISIKKPNAAPVALADSAPRPGEMLTIAGYGSGHYRAASGPCTQYVAPGLEFPFEMVEVAVSARQGDSGGPMFNSQGELAGVLFGEGNGRTSGSYCGRVRWFLSTIVPRLNDRAKLASAPPLRNVPARPAANGSLPAPPKSDDAVVPAGGFAQASRSRSVETPVSDRRPVVASTAAGPAQHEVRELGWHDLAGDTFGEQAKSVLAGIGLLAIVLQALGWLSRDPTAAKAK